MSEQDNEELDSTNQATEEVVNTEVVEDAAVEEATEDESSKLEELNKKLFERAKKAEAEVKELKTKLKPAKASESTPQDPDALPQKAFLALIQAQVHADDYDDVVNAAKILNLPVEKAVNHSVVKTILAEKAEQRKTANATNVGTAKRSVNKVSGESLLEKAQKGDMPESDADIEKLARARLGLKE